MKPTIRVRIAVAIDSGGEWHGYGWGGQDKPHAPDAMSLARESVGTDAAEYWIEAEVPIPSSTTPRDVGVIDGVVKTRDE